MTTAEVLLWGTRIGAVGFRKDSTTAAVFEYDRAFTDSATGVEPSPILMPRKSGRYAFPEASQRTFRGLPGMLVDSLPDKFGTSLLDRWLVETDRDPKDINIVERLLYMADRAMGALTFKPVRELIETPDTSVLDISHLTELANAVVTRNESLHEALESTENAQTALNLIRVGTSAGGARAKAIVTETPAGDFLPGHEIHKTPHQYWLLKFDGIEGNADRDDEDPPGMTTVEYIYSLFARRAGIHMPDTRLLEVGNRRHFMIERFDRIVTEEKTDRLHYASWCGMAHAHRDWPGAYGYEQLALLCRQLGLPHEDMEELYRRAVYNVVGVNHDDHTKNFGFLMNRRGEWRLSPAFDLTYACDPTGRWTRTHQTAMNGKTSDFTTADLISFASHCNISDRDAARIISRVREAFTGWDALFREYEVPVETAETITGMLAETSRRLES